jgi:hypothetical protein
MFGLAAAQVPNLGLEARRSSAAPGFTALHGNAVEAAADRQTI